MRGSAKCIVSKQGSGTFPCSREAKTYGKPKPVAFPNPEACSLEADEIHWLRLPILVELKLASGMTNSGRLKDLADVQELIRSLNLPIDFVDQLNPFIQDKYREFYISVQPT